MPPGVSADSSSLKACDSAAFVNLPRKNAWALRLHITAIERKVWHYVKADVGAIKRSLENFPWAQQLNLNSDPNWQVKMFHGTFLNIMSNFIPNDVKKCVPRDPPWISRSLKTLLKKKNRLFDHYKKHGYKEDDKTRLETFRTECQEAVQKAKLSYMTNLGHRLKDPGITSKKY